MSDFNYNTSGKNVIREPQLGPRAVAVPVTKTTHQKQDPISEVKNYRIFLSSAGKTNAYQFKENIDERLTQINQVRFLTCMLKYTEPATDAALHETLFVRLKNFPTQNFNVSARTTNNFEYHAAIPTNTYTLSGTVVKTFTIFPFDYRINIGSRRINVKDIEVEVYYQDDTTGEFALFTDLTFFTMELEFK